MSRLDYKEGRWAPRYETTEADRALLGTQSVWGDWIDYYRFSSETSVTHGVYDEPVAGGRWFSGPIRLPVMHMVRDEGMPGPSPGGIYWTDTSFFAVPYAGLVRAGLGTIDTEHGDYVRDRVVYDDRVWRVSRIQVHGQLRRRDMTAVVTVTQLKSEDLTGDAQFSAWAGKENSIDLPQA